MAHPPGRDDPAGAAVAADDGGGGDANRWPTGGRCWGCRVGCDGWRSTIHRLSTRRTDSSTSCRRHGLTSWPRADHRLVAAHPRVQRGARRRHEGPRPGRHPCARCGAAVHVRLPAPAARRRPGRPPRRRRRGLAADGRRGHRRVRPGRLRAVGAPDHRRASGDPAGAPAGARRARAAVGPGRARARPAVRRRRGRAPGGRVDRRAFHRRAQGRDPRQPHRADPPARRGRGLAATTGPRSSSARRRSAIYGFDRGDALLCEDSVRGDGFLADVVADWEAATGAGRRGGAAGGHRAHRNRAGRAGGTLQTAAAAVRGRAGRPARQWQAVAVLDRPRRPARRLLPRAVRRRG